MIEGLQPYAEYKESGLPWLATIPGHWRTARNGNLFQQRNETQHPDLPILEVSLRTGVRVREFGASGRKQVMADASKYKRAARGDVAYNMMRMWQGAVGVAPIDGLVSPAYVVARPFPGTVARYYTSLFRNGVYMGEIDAASRGIVKDRNRLYWDQFKQMRSLVPPPDEQAAIVRFLDHANRKIDGFIRAKRKLIALLGEQKQAIIHLAVTRGRDPNVSLKPSGIPWLGDIPKHWEVLRLKSLGTKFGSGVTPRGGASVYQESGIPLLRSQNVHNGELRLDKVARIAPRIHASMSGTQVKPGDVLLNITGASIGRVCAVPQTLLEANVNQHVCIIRPISKRCEADYIAMFLATNAAQNAIYIAQNGSSREGMAVSEVKTLPIVLPPLDEQREIGLKVRAETQSLDTAITRTVREIALMQEYRARLTVDIVTGKLDVREAAGFGQ